MQSRYVYPSAGWLVANCTPVTPPAPALLLTTTDTPSSFSRAEANVRSVVSAPPPVPHGQIISTFLSHFQSLAASSAPVSCAPSADLVSAGLSAVPELLLPHPARLTAIAAANARLNALFFITSSPFLLFNCLAAVWTVPSALDYIIHFFSSFSTAFV